MESPKYATPVLEDHSQFFSKIWFSYLTRKPYTTPENEISNGTTFSLAHGLGREPRMADAVLVCKEADLGYAVGQRVWLSGFEDTSDYGASISADTAKLYLTVGANGIRLMQVAGAIGQFAAITNSRWRIVVVVD